MKQAIQTIIISTFLPLPLSPLCLKQAKPGTSMRVKKCSASQRERESLSQDEDIMR